MEKRTIITIIIMTGILVGLIPTGIFAASYDPISVTNPEIELKCIDGGTASTKAENKAKILFFFNTKCSHCLTIEESLKTKGFNTAEVDIIMAESYPKTFEEAQEFYAGCGLEDVTFCYDAKDECWTYLRACGYTGSVVVKPVIIYIGEDNIIRGYSTNNVDIYSEAKKYGIYMEKHEHEWKKVYTAAQFCKDGERHYECTVCGKTKGSVVIPGLGPSAVSIKKISRYRKAARVYWTRPSKSRLKKISGYQIGYSVKKSMSGAKYVRISSRDTTSRKIKKLKSGKKYYFRMRAYKRSNGKYYYSKWSAVKSAKIK